MKRSGFTLIELMISIVLFGLISIFMYGALNGLRKQQIFFHEKEERLLSQTRVLSLLRGDLFRPQSARISHTSSPDFDIVTIEGSNQSLYGIDLPHVVWVVLKNGHLLRLESANSIILPLPSHLLYTVHSDLIAEECEIFRLHDSPKHRLIYLQTHNNSPLILETTK